MVRHIYGDAGQSIIDGLYARNPARSLLFDPEQQCFRMTGFSDVEQSECVEMLFQVQSDAFALKFKKKTSQGIMIFQLIPVLSERDLVQTGHDFVRNQRDRLQSRLYSRSLNAVRTRWQQINPRG